MKEGGQYGDAPGATFGGGVVDRHRGVDCGGEILLGDVFGGEEAAGAYMVSSRTPSSFLSTSIPTLRVARAAKR